MTRSKHCLTETKSSNTDSLPLQVNSRKHPCFPNTVKIAPLVGIKNKFSRGWLLFALAKNFVTDGNDHVDRDLVEQFCKSLGFKPLTLRRMFDSARGMGLITDVERKGGHYDLILVSNKRVSRQATGQEQQKTVLIDPKLLVGNGWKANVWAAYEATFEGRLISRKKLQEFSGVPEVTQRAYDKQAGVHRVANYAVSNIHANGYNVVLDYGNRAGLFKYWDRNTHQLKLGWRIPDSRSFSRVQTNGSNKTRRALSLFNRTQESLIASRKHVSQSDLPIRELYVFSHISKNGRAMWTHIPLTERGS